MERSTAAVIILHAIGQALSVVLTWLECDLCQRRYVIAPMPQLSQHSVGISREIMLKRLEHWEDRMSNLLATSQKPC